MEEGAPLASGVETMIVAEELGRGLGDVAFLGPTLAAELRRLAGAPPSPTVETVAVAIDLLSLAGTVKGETRSAVAIDVQGSSTALLLVPGSEGHVLAQTDLNSAVGLDLTRPSMMLGPPLTSPTSRRRNGRLRPTISPAGQRSASP